MYRQSKREKGEISNGQWRPWGQVGAKSGRKAGQCHAFRRKVGIIGLLSGKTQVSVVAGMSSWEEVDF